MVYGMTEMIPDVKENLARAKARTILSALSLKHPCDMDIEDIAWARGALVKRAPMHGAEGRLVRMADKGVITIKYDIVEIGRSRFGIAHELGHFELHTDIDQLELCTNRDLIYEYKSVRPEEKEANTFARELLLPEDLTKDRCQQAYPTFKFIRELAKEFQTSETLTAMRFIEFTSQRAALVVCENGKIKWYKPSAYFGYAFAIGDQVDSGTCAYELFKGNGEEMSDSVTATSWLHDGNRVDENAFIKEEAIYHRRYNTTLSLLCIDRDVEIEDRW